MGEGDDHAQDDLIGLYDVLPVPSKEGVVHHH